MLQNTLKVNIKMKQRVTTIANWICTPIIFKNPLKTCFFIKKYTFTICVGCVWIVIYISYSKYKLLTFNGLLRVSGIQSHFKTILL